MTCKTLFLVHQGSESKRARWIRRQRLSPQGWFRNRKQTCRSLPSFSARGWTILATDSCWLGIFPISRTLLRRLSSTNSNEIVCLCVSIARKLAGPLGPNKNLRWMTKVMARSRASTRALIQCWKWRRNGVIDEPAHLTDEAAALLNAGNDARFQYILSKPW